MSFVRGSNSAFNSSIFFFSSSSSISRHLLHEFRERFKLGLQLLDLLLFVLVLDIQ